MVKRFCTSVLTLLTIALPTSLQAGEGDQLMQCKDSITTALVKILAQDRRSPSQSTTLKLTQTFELALDNYCQCRLKWQQKHAAGDWIAESFRDPRELLGEDDQCALETFKHDEYQMIFLTQINLKLIPIIQVRLEERYRGGTFHLATLASYNSHLRCLSDKMIHHCAKTYSLATTYQCLHSFWTQARKIGPLEKDCPDFKADPGEEGLDEIDLSGPRS